MAIIFLWPVEYQITRIGFAAAVAMTWAGALVLSWKKKSVRVALIFAGMLPAMAVCMPGRVVDHDLLAADYSRGLRLFRGTRYVWGGEGFLGIDCSGLVRKGLIWGQLLHGLRTFNGGPIREAIDLWWHDCSAMALGDGYRGWTTELFRHDSVAGADHSPLKPGDLAVTADGVHVMAYLGNHTWIEADPDAHKVIQVTLPTDNPWFNKPVTFVRWKCFNPAGSRTYKGMQRTGVKVAVYENRVFHEKRATRRQGRPCYRGVPFSGWWFFSAAGACGRDAAGMESFEPSIQMTWPNLRCSNV
jgi:cell wall-associated NlpC family hydrolase